MKIKITVRYKINAISTEITNSNWYSKISMLLFKAGRGAALSICAVISGKYYH